VASQEKQDHHHRHRQNLVFLQGQLAMLVLRRQITHHWPIMAIT
jgi:hypothetical protein